LSRVDELSGPALYVVGVPKIMGTGDAGAAHLPRNVAPPDLLDIYEQHVPWEVRS